jgi:hypothetical protein
MARKTTDPKLIALRDKLAKAAAAHDRWFSKLKRAVNTLDRLRRQLVRLSRQVQEMEHPQPKE